MSVEQVMDTASALPCDICGKPMTVTRWPDGGGTLECTSCDQCWSFMADGTSYCAVLGSLYPSDMAETDPLYREFVEYRRKMWHWNAQARFAVGVWTEAQRDERIAEANRVVDDWLAAHPLGAEPRRPWWRFWA